MLVVYSLLGSIGAGIGMIITLSFLYLPLVLAVAYVREKSLSKEKVKDLLFSNLIFILKATGLAMYALFFLGLLEPFADTW